MNFGKSLKTCKCVPREGEQIVISGLSYSPAAIQNLTAAAKAVTLHNLDNFAFYDNPSEDSQVPLIYKRGVDENDLWNLAKETKSKLKKFQQQQKFDKQPSSANV